MSKSPHAPKLTAKQVKEIRAFYAGGESAATVAVWYDVSESAVLYHTKDIRRSRPHYSKVDKAELGRLIEQGSSRADIARHFKCTWEAVHFAAKRLGVETERQQINLDEQQVSQIRTLYAQGERQHVLARMFKVSQGTIQRRVADMGRGRIAA